MNGGYAAVLLRLHGYMQRHRFVVVSLAIVAACFLLLTVTCIILVFFCCERPPKRSCYFGCDSCYCCRERLVVAMINCLSWRRKNKSYFVNNDSPSPSYFPLPDVTITPTTHTHCPFSAGRITFSSCHRRYDPHNHEV